MHSEPPGEKARGVLRRDAVVISPSVMREYPLVLQKASGVNLWDVDGNRYLDFTAGIAVMNTGWNHPNVVAAVQEQANSLSHGAFMDFCSEIPVRCAEELVGFFPDGLDRVYYANSGAESVEAAMKLARHHTGRNYCILSVYVRNFGVWGRALWSHSGGTPEHGFPPGIAMTAPALGVGGTGIP